VGLVLLHPASGRRAPHRHAAGRRAGAPGRRDDGDDRAHRHDARRRIVEKEKAAAAAAATALFAGKGDYFVWGEDWSEDELEGELDVPELELSPEVAPLPAEPLEDGLEDEDDAPPPDWLFCWSGLVADELLDGEELDGEELIEPEAEPEDDGVDGVVAPLDDEDDGEVDDGLDEVLDEPVAARSEPPLSHAVSKLAPSAMETAIARVESLMWPPWLGYLGVEQGLGRAARHLSTYLLRVCGAVSALFGPATSPDSWKSRCWFAWLGSTCCETGFEPLRLSSRLPPPLLTEDCTGALPPAAEEAGAALVLGAGVGVGLLRSQPAAKASEIAATSVKSFMDFSCR
jgi:hypothetical protein